MSPAPKPKPEVKVKARSARAADPSKPERPGRTGRRDVERVSTPALAAASTTDMPTSAVASTAATPAPDAPSTAASPTPKAPQARPKPTTSGGTLSDPADWVAMHGDYLYRYAMLRVRNPDLAEELVQETYVAALRSRGSFAGKSSERTWYVGILKHKIIDNLRKSKRERPMSEVDMDRGSEDAFFDLMKWKRPRPRNWAKQPGASMEATEFWGVFQDCLKGLPERLALAFTLREVDEMPGDEICAALDITPSNFWVMLHRARLRLRSCLEVKWFGNQGADESAGATSQKKSKRTRKGKPSG